MAETFLAKELAEYLEAQGFGRTTNPGRTIYYGESPPTPDDVVVVLEEPGGPPRLTISESRSATVVVRAVVFEDGLARAQEIQRALHEQQGILSTIQVARITADTQPISLGRDQNDRHQFSQGYSVLTKPLKPLP